MPSELKFWAAAFIHMFESLSNDQLGLKKYLRPMSAPSSVRARPRKTTININGSVAVKYRALVDDFMDFHMAKYTRIQAQTRHATNSQRIRPASSIPPLI